MWAKLDQASAVYYDITWTGFCGAEVPSELNNIFDVVRNGRDRAIERVQAAVAARQTLHGFEVDDAARQYITAKGFGEYFVHRTGHSIGEEVHGTGANMDNLETHDERMVIPRTCFSIEPGVYLPKFGIRSEVNMYIGEDAARVTGEKQTEMIRII
jgi:Xaa-Pro aminopeptidase